MFWVVQQNLYNEYGYTALMDCIIRAGIPHAVVKPVAIINKLVPADFDSFSFKGYIEDAPEPYIDESGLVMVCGAVTMSKVAQKRNWVPGSFINENFDFEVWRQHYGEHLLNYDSQVCRFADLPKVSGEFFMRPCEDSKAFAGFVTTWDYYDMWRADVLRVNDDMQTLNGSTMITFASVKNILREYRFFVVDGKIVTGSLYKLGDRVTYMSDIDPDVLAYAQSRVDQWQPARAFVIDIALLEGGEKKVIEINNFNSAGFYASDVSKIVGAIEDMKF